MEKAMITFPITEENFQQAWAYVDENRRKAVVRKWVRKTAGSVGNFVFFLLACLLFYGYYRQIDSAAFGEFLRRIPVLPQIWDWLLDTLIKPELGTWGQLGVLAMLLYGIPFLLEVLVSVAVRLCCHPKEKPLPEGEAKETAKLLLEETEKLIISKGTKHLPSGVGWNLIFLVLSAGMIAAFALVAGFEGNEEVVMNITMELYSYKFLVLVLGCWLGYAVVNYPLLQLTRLLYIMKLPEELGNAAKNHMLRSDPEKKAQLEEEDRILALAEEIKARRIRERQELLQKSQKKK